jgi:predicted helicase
MDNNLERLRSIKTFPSLVKYLRDELDWPIESDDVEDLSFDYEPEELGLDPKTAVKIKEIKQLRPFVTGQPWGIFFISFEPKRLPIVALRRILRSLVIKKRQSSSKSQQATWQLNDLLFISSYGESEEREISFAHFSDDDSMGDLPTLKVLGWNAQNTVLRLEDTQQVLKEKLQWPEDENDVDAWRLQWSSAFKLQYRETVRTSKDLAIKLADLATLIRARVNDVLEVESESGELRKLYKAFQEALIHDLTEDDFADMYAQTIAYGLLTASISRQSGGLVADNLKDMVPNTNPFLKELMQTFLTVGGRKGKIDFDELGINDVVELMRHTQMDEVLKDFGAKNPQEDPVIHFYELFLKEYDPEKRMKRGVFYTPRPVVSFIVRSVDEILRTEFSLEDGLADTTTWGEMAKRHKRLNIPKGVGASEPFVQILDPATGTGTFLVEVIGVIHDTMVAKWKREGMRGREIVELWNEYVPRNLLPRVHGFELMMAPYAIAHMKIGLKLRETHYSFLSSERARIYLTNALEEPKEFPAYFEQMAPALAHEATAANVVKATTPATVIIGNPPYSRVSQNKSDFIRNLMVTYKEPVADEANQQPLDDDYIKFIRFSHYLQEHLPLATVGIITNHTIHSGVLFRGVRQVLLSEYPKGIFVDLHGNSNTKEKSPDGSADKNVFDILAGVGINLLTKTLDRNDSRYLHAELWGTRESKYAQLLNYDSSSIPTTRLSPTPKYYFLTPKDFSLDPEYRRFWPVNILFPLFSSGLMTVRDNLAVAFDYEELKQRFEEFRDKGVSDKEFQAKIPVKDYRGWSLANARKQVRADKQWLTRLQVANYRPFDKRYVFYGSDIITYPNYRVMNQFILPNLGLITTRINKGEAHAHEFASREMTEIIFLSSKSSNNAFLFPLWRYTSVEGRGLLNSEEKEANLSADFIRSLEGSLGLRWTTNKSEDPSSTFDAPNVFHYIYAVLHSPTYRNRYSEFLKIDFPRLPITSDAELFRKLILLGSDLVALHLLEDEYEAASWSKLPAKRKSPLKTHITRFTGRGRAEVAKGHPKFKDGNVYINPEHYFEGVPEEVWSFHIGGYQVCEKWLKDRRGRILSEEDINHYQRVVVALNQTIRLMAEIDRVIEEHGGWPLVGSQEGVSSVAVPSISDHHEVDQSEPLSFE